MDRRSFLKTCAAATVAPLVGGCGAMQAPASEVDVQVTGLKLTPVFSTREMGRRNPADKQKSISKHVIVELQTNAAHVGLGEMSDVKWAVDRAALRQLQLRLESVVVGRELRDIHLLLVRIAAVKWDHQVEAGIETALYDALGKSLGMPLYELFGGRVRDSIPFAYPLAPCRLPEDVGSNLTRVRKKVERGHDGFRYYFGADLDLDERFLEEVRNRWGSSIRLVALDASGRFTVEEAITAINRFAQFKPELVESPVKGRHRGAAEDFAAVRDAVGVPIGEHIPGDVEAARYVNVVDVFNSGPGWTGFDTAQRVFTVAEVFGVKALLGSTVELSIGTAARAHLGLTVRNLDFGCYMAGPLVYREQVVRERVEYKSGRVFLTDRPGLGLELDPEKLARQTLA